MQPRDKKLRPQFIAFAVVLAVLGFAHQWVNPWLAFDRAAIEGGAGVAYFYLSSGAPESLAFAAQSGRVVAVRLFL